MKFTPVWKSFVWHNDKCFFVSTIERDYNTVAGCSRGQETHIFEFDWDKNEKGKWIYDATRGSHVDACQQLLTTGKYKEEPND